MGSRQRLRWVEAGARLVFARAPDDALRRARGLGTASLVLGLAGALGCTSLSDDLSRAETAFHAARYEDVQVWLADLEPSLPKLNAQDRARFYYLAGMSAQRIGEHARARHALALCREELDASHEQLPAAWMQNLSSALAAP